MRNIQAEEEEERHRVLATQARVDSADSAATGIPVKPSATVAGWPGKQTGLGMALPKKGGSVGVGAAASSTKKKMVIKLKKKP